MKNYLKILSLIFLVASCSASKAPASYQGHYKVGKPYKINKITYRPRVVKNYSETGIASWYGPKFHGRKTANGETFNRTDLTAAHRTLPLPSIVKVTNLKNNKSVILRVNDRGPFARNKHGRIIDLSERAAELLDIKHNGIAKVKVDLLPRATTELHKKLAINQHVPKKIA